MTYKYEFKYEIIDRLRKERDLLKVENKDMSHELEFLRKENKKITDALAFQGLLLEANRKALRDGL